jgi:hypothetical protein
VPFTGQILRILIASPSDTASARAVLDEVIQEWNAMNAEKFGVVLLSRMWERDASPEMGGGPQAVINRQLVDEADALLGTFWTRLGTPTSEAESGTAEEIRRLVDARKPVALYFSDEPVVPSSIDSDQYERLRAFREFDLVGRPRGYVVPQIRPARVTGAAPGFGVALGVGLDDLRLPLVGCCQVVGPGFWSAKLRLQAAQKEVRWPRSPLAATFPRARTSA